MQSCNNEQFLLHLTLPLHDSLQPCRIRAPRRVVGNPSEFPAPAVWSIRAPSRVVGNPCTWLRPHAGLDGVQVTRARVVGNPSEFHAPDAASELQNLTRRVPTRTSTREGSQHHQGPAEDTACRYQFLIVIQTNCKHLHSNSCRCFTQLSSNPFAQCRSMDGFHRRSPSKQTCDGPQQRDLNPKP